MKLYIIIILGIISTYLKGNIEYNTKLNINISDSLVTEEYPIVSFSNLNVQLGNKYQPITIYLSSNSYTHAYIYGDKSNISKIKIKQVGEIINITLDENSSIINSRLEIHLFTPIIKNVKLNSQGFIEIYDFDDLNELQTIISGCGAIHIRTNKSNITKSKIKNLFCEIKGSGQIFVTGKYQVENCSLNISGDGEIRLKSIDTKKASININGNGIISLTASESLKGIINGGGTIYYYGNLINPKIEINGCGEIIENDFIHNNN
jgi:hypothetical protein